jgi:hypothetical protein
MVLGILFVVGSLGLSLGVTLESGVASTTRAVDRTAAYYLAEGVVERLIAERLAGDPDWSDVTPDTFYAAVPVDQGVCTLVTANRGADQLDVSASARLRGTVSTLALRVRRIAGSARWERLGAPYVTTREE